MTDSEFGRRRHERVPLVVEVAYRTTGNFLVSYSLNLSKGGLFVETPSPLPEGTPLTLKVRIPGLDEPVEVSGRVVWVRWEPKEGKPAGMGVAFQNLDDHVGRIIDTLAATFKGLRILFAGYSSSGKRSVDHRIETLFPCTMERAADVDTARRLLDESEWDLLVVDLDSLSVAGLEIIDEVVSGLHPGVPILALTARPAHELAARRAGADGCARPTASSWELKSAVLGCLARPITRGDPELGPNPAPRTPNSGG